MLIGFFVFELMSHRAQTGNFLRCCHIRGNLILNSLQGTNSVIKGWQWISDQYMSIFSAPRSISHLSATISGPMTMAYLIIIVCLCCKKKTQSTRGGNKTIRYTRTCSCCLSGIRTHVLRYSFYTYDAYMCHGGKFASVV